MLDAIPSKFIGEWKLEGDNKFDEYLKSEGTLFSRTKLLKTKHFRRQLAYSQIHRSTAIYENYKKRCQSGPLYDDQFSTNNEL